VTLALAAAATLLLAGSFLVIRALLEADQDAPTLRQLPQTPTPVHRPEQRKAA
jgi:hypothetical protein